MIKINSTFFFINFINNNIINEYLLINCQLKCYELRLSIKDAQGFQLLPIAKTASCSRPARREYVASCSRTAHREHVTSCSRTARREYVVSN